MISRLILKKINFFNMTIAAVLKEFYESTEENFRKNRFTTVV